MFPQLRLSGVAVLLGTGLFCALPARAADGVKLTQLDGKVRVEIGGQLFTEYHFTDARRPYLYPVIGPTGAGMTRNWPLKEGVPGEEADHVHHKGLWFGHHRVNGVGFWEDSGKPGARLGKVLHDQFLEVTSGKDVGVLRASNNWRADEGELICTDERTLRFHSRPGGRLLDFEITLRAGPKDVVFGDDKDGVMAIRIAESMRLKKPREKGAKQAAAGDGHIVLSTGVRDADTWGKRAAWCDYFGPVEGKTVGVAIFDHPGNPRHPTWWHVRDYGLFAANAFGQAQFEKLDNKSAGDYTIPAGKTVTWKYRYYFHAGDEQQGQVAARYAEFTQPK